MSKKNAALNAKIFLYSRIICLHAFALFKSLKEFGKMYGGVVRIDSSFHQHEIGTTPAPGTVMALTGRQRMIKKNALPIAGVLLYSSKYPRHTFAFYKPLERDLMRCATIPGFKDLLMPRVHARHSWMRQMQMLGRHVDGIAETGRVGESKIRGCIGECMGMTCSLRIPHV